MDEKPKKPAIYWVLVVILGVVGTYGFWVSEQAEAQKYNNNFSVCDLPRYYDPGTGELANPAQANC